MLRPKRRKFNKAFTGRIRGIETKGIELNFGSYGMKALEPGRITAAQIESARRVMTRKMKRAGRLWIRIFPDVPVSRKPVEIRMGKGKGAIDHWAAPVKPGRILFEFDGVTEAMARQMAHGGGAKLPVRTVFVMRPGLHNLVG